MDGTSIRNKEDTVRVSSEGKSIRELELELQNALLQLEQKEEALFHEQEINRLLREVSNTQKIAIEQERKELQEVSERFNRESKAAMKSLEEASRAYKDATADVVSNDDFLEFCKTIRINEKLTAYDFERKLKSQYRQYESDRHDRLIELEIQARKQRSAAMATVNRIKGENISHRMTGFDFDDEASIVNRTGFEL